MVSAILVRHERREFADELARFELGRVPGRRRRRFARAMPVANAKAAL
jgi:hypothetical protein